MESVEELCEHIALIHRSRKILEGKLSAIKQQYKLNRFRVRWVPHRGREALEALKEKISLSEPAFDAEENAWEFTVQLEVNGQGELLSYLTSTGILSFFREVIPTANDIFIQTVQNQELHA
jgi:ABC-2 type transport system ATP-binding protein